jgi:hypothetical protein
MADTTTILDCPLRNSVSGGNGNLRLVGAMAALIAIQVASIAAVSKLLQQQIDHLNGRIGVMNATLDVWMSRVEAKAEQLNTAQLRSDRNQARLDDLEEFQRWWYRTIQPIDQTQSAQIKAIEQRLNVEKDRE